MLNFGYWQEVLLTFHSLTITKLKNKIKYLINCLREDTYLCKILLPRCSTQTKRKTGIYILYIDFKKLNKLYLKQSQGQSYPIKSSL